MILIMPKYVIKVLEFKVEKNNIFINTKIKFDLKVTYALE